MPDQLVSCARNSTTQHRHLMPQHQQLDIRHSRATTAGHHKREQHPEHRVQSREQHRNDHAEPSRYGGAEVIEPHTLYRSHISPDREITAYVNLHTR